MMRKAANRQDTNSYSWRDIFLFMAAWSVILAFSLGYNLDQNKRSFEANLLSEAKAHHMADLEYRSWVIGHGGVYVPATKNTPPSPYLAHVQERDVTTPSGKTLTLLNSSYVMRQVHESLERHAGGALHGRIASLNPINPDNMANAWEAKALKQFQDGKVEVSEMRVMVDGKPFFRYMRPMVTEASCLKCHAGYGDKLGDIRGGISISIPIEGDR